eukprot:357778-Chlamydomonas_euryale.AAC.7
MRGRVPWEDEGQGPLGRCGAGSLGKMRGRVPWEDEGQGLSSLNRDPSSPAEEGSPVAMWLLCRQVKAQGSENEARWGRSPCNARACKESRHTLNNSRQARGRAALDDLRQARSCHTLTTSSWNTPTKPAIPATPATPCAPVLLVATSRQTSWLAG